MNYVKKFALLIIINLFFNANLFSFDSSKDTTHADEVIIIGSRSPITFQESGRTIDLITSSKIKKSTSQNLEEILKTLNNIDLRQRGASGATADLGIRGGHHDQTLIMLNGIKMTDLQTGHHNLDLPIDLESINKIEIVSGGASRVLGPNAFSGAVNFITTPSKDLSSNIKLSAGSHKYYGISLNANIPISDFGIFLSFNKNKSDGYIANTDFDYMNFFSGINYNATFGEFNLDLGYNTKEFGANSFYTPVYPNQFEATSAKFSSLRYSWGNDFKVNANLYYREHNDRFELIKHGLPAPVWYTSPNYHQTKTYGYELKTAYTYFLGTSSLGFEYRNENILSNNLGNPLLNDDFIKVPNEENALFTKAGFRNSANLYFEHNTEIGNLTASFGALYNKTTNYDGKIYPGIDISYRLSNNFSIFSSYNKSLRFPTFTELYYNTKTQQGDINLKPEEAHSIELGTKYSSNSFSFNSAIFYRIGENMIDWIKYTENGLPTSDKFMSYNIAKINTLGFEVGANINLNELFQKELFFNNISISYSYIDMKSKENVNYISTYALDNLRHKLAGSLFFTFPLDINLNLDAIYEARNGQYILYENMKEIGLTNYEPHFLLNAKLSKNIYSFIFALTVTNIFDKQYIDIGNLLQPGRDIRFSITYRFAKKK